TLLTDNRGLRIDAYSDAGAPPDARSEYFSLDTPKLWLDPASSNVHRHLCGLAADLLDAYPALSGLHLDFFRYPYLLPMQPSSRSRCCFEFGYGEESRAKFEEHRGGNGCFESVGGALRPSSDAVSLHWDCWRRAQIEKYLVSFRELLKPAQQLSVAC